MCKRVHALFTEMDGVRKIYQSDLRHRSDFFFCGLDLIFVMIGRVGCVSDAVV